MLLIIHLEMLLGNTYVNMRIALNPSTASAFGVYTQRHADERLQCIFYKQLERLQGLAKLYGGVDTIITAVITTRGPFICVCAHAYCRLLKWQQLCKTVCYTSVDEQRGLVKFIWALTGYRKLLETAIIGHYKDMVLSRCSSAGLKAVIDFKYWSVSHRHRLLTFAVKFGTLWCLYLFFLLL